MSANLSFYCPHCQHRYVDDMELLDAQTLHVFTCERCRAPFNLHYVACPCCCTDVAWAWRSPDSAPAMTDALCPACGAPLAPQADADLADDEPAWCDSVPDLIKPPP